MKSFCSLSIVSLTFFSPVLSAHELENLFVSGRQVNLIGSASSASEGLVSQKEIQVRPLLRTGEVLELVPGMVATQHSGNGKANQYFLRGFNLDHGSDFATHVDGMPVNLRSHGHGQGYTDLNFLIPELIDELAYKKGAYYADVGDFSGAGSAQVSTAKRLNSGVVSLSVGEYGHRRLVFGDGYELGNGDILIGAERQIYEGPWNDIDEDLSKTNLLVGYAKSLGVGEFSAKAMHYESDWNSADQIPERAIEQGLVDAFGSLDTTLGGNSRRSSVNLAWQSDSWHASTYYVDSDLNLWSNFTYFLDDSVNGDQFEQVDDRSIFGGQLVFSQNKKILNTHTKTRAGITFQLDDIDEVGLYNTVTRSRTGVVRSDNINQQSLSLFLENKAQWTPKFSSVLGVRYDHYDFKVRGLVNENSIGINLSENGGSASDDLVSFKASLSYLIGNEWEAYVSAGQGFHSNDARGTTIKVDPGTGAEVSTVDPLVRSFSYETGLRGFISDRLNTSVALWALDLDSELLFVGDAGNTEASGASERYGVEFASYFYLNDNWTFDLELALSDAAFSEASGAGKEIPGAINQVLQAGLSADFKNGWSGSLRLRHFGERPLTEDDSVRSDASTLWNLRTAYQTGKTSFRLDVLNIGDSTDHDIDYFYESRLAGEAAEGVAGIHSRTLEPRSLRFSISYQL